MTSLNDIDELDYKQNRKFVDRFENLNDIASKQIRKGNSLKSFVQSLISLPNFKNGKIQATWVGTQIIYQSYETLQEYHARIKLDEKNKIKEEKAKAARLQKYLDLKAEFES